MDDPVFVNYLRIAYVSAQVLAVGIYFYITQVVSGSIVTRHACSYPDQEEEYSRLRKPSPSLCRRR